MVQEHFKPETINEALALLEEYGEDAGLIAGGTDLIVRKKKGIELPACVIDLRGIKGLDAICHTERGLSIGATMAMATIATSDEIRGKYTALAESAEQLASGVIRIQATLGGNLCNAAPSAETGAPLFALGASVQITSLNGKRLIPVEELFLGPGKVSLTRGEILTAVLLPPVLPCSASVYLKHTRRHGADLALVGVAVGVHMDGEIIREIKIALAAVAPTVIHAGEAERLLAGEKPDAGLIAAAGAAAAAAAKPIDDVRSSADYRKKMVAVLTERAVTAAIQRTRGGRS